MDDDLLPAPLPLLELLADAQDRPQPRVDRARELGRDDLVRFARVAPPLRMADDHPGRESREHRGADLARVRARQLVVDVLRSDGHVLARERVAHRGQADVRRADDPRDAGLTRPGGDRPCQLTGVGGRRVHLPVGGDHDRSSRSAHARRRPVLDPAVFVERQELDPLECALDRRPMEAEALRELRERRLGRLAPGVGDRPDDVRLLPQPPIGGQLIDRRELPAGGSDRAPEIGRLRVQHPVEVAPKRPRHRPGLELEQRRPRPDPAQERPDRVGALPGHDAAAPPDPPRRGQPGGSELAGQRRRLVEPDDELEMGPRRGHAQGPAREEQPAQIGHPAVLGCGVPVERPARVAQPQPDRETGQRRLARMEARPEAGGLRGPVARSPRIDRRELGPERLDELPIRPRHALRAPERAAGVRRFAPPSRSMTRMTAAASRAGSW